MTSMLPAELVRLWLTTGVYVFVLSMMMTRLLDPDEEDEDLSIMTPDKRDLFEVSWLVVLGVVLWPMILVLFAIDLIRGRWR